MNSNIIFVKKPAIIASLQATKHGVIEAHAGTGKTFTIEHFVIDLLLCDKHYNLQEILIVTFTEKAARELRERVRTLIEKILYKSDESIFCETANDAWVIGDDERLVLKQALFSFELSQISTMHGFCSRVLRETAFQVRGVMERDFAKYSVVFTKAFAAIFREHLALDPLCQNIINLWLENEGSFEKLQQFLQKALLKGYGNNKRIKQIKLPVPIALENIIANIATVHKKIISILPNLQKRTSQKCRNAVGSILINKSKYPKASGAAFAAFEEGINHVIIPANTQELLLWLIKKDNDIQNGYYKILTEKLAENSELDTNTANVFLEIAEILQNIPTFKEITLNILGDLIHQKVIEIKADMGVGDFDDLLLDLEWALRHNEGQSVEFLRSRFKIALIDEFQDTCPVQWSIFKTIFFDSPDHRIFLVGDPKQAIYGFRGADIATYLKATKLVLENKEIAARITLENNFRSSQRLIDAYNIILSSKGSFFQDGNINYKNPVTCGDTSLKLLNCEGGEVTNVVRLIKLNDTKSKLTTTSYNKFFAHFISAEIAQLTTNNTIIRKGVTKKISPSDIFVLTRTNTEARNLSRILLSHAIPTTLFQNGSVFLTTEAEDMFYLLKAIAMPYDAGIVHRFLLSPFANYTIENLYQENTLKNWSQVLDNWRKLYSHKLSDLFKHAFTQTKILNRLILENNTRGYTNFLHLAELISSWQDIEGLVFLDIINRMDALLSEVDDTEEDAWQQRIETDAFSVQIITMHKSKGLEAPIVFFYGGLSQIEYEGFELIDVGGLNEQETFIINNKTNRYLQERASLKKSELDRLLYVALTRAGCLLYLPYFEKIEKDSKLIWESSKFNGLYFHLAERLWNLISPNSAINADISERQQFAALASLQIINTSEINTEIPINIEYQKSHVNTEYTINESEILYPPNYKNIINNLQNDCKAPLLTSYTKLKRGMNHSYDEPKQPNVDNIIEVERNLLLGAGAEFGIKVHKCMQNMPLHKVTLCNTAAELLSDPSICKILSETFIDIDFSSEKGGALADFIFASLKIPLLGETVLCFADLTTFVREWEFCLPWPEAIIPEGFHKRRAYINGALDAIFEHEGKYYVLDWKTDILENYEIDTVEQHFTENYLLQAKIYLLALTNYLQINSAEEYECIGGFVYIFMRKPLTFTGNIAWQQLVDFKNLLQNAQGTNL